MHKQAQPGVLLGYEGVIKVLKKKAYIQNELITDLLKIHVSDFIERHISFISVILSESRTSNQPEYKRKKKSKQW